MAHEDVAPGEILLSVPLDSVFSDIEVSLDCFDLILDYLLRGKTPQSRLASLLHD